MTFVGPTFHLLSTEMHERLKDQLWHTGGPGDTLPGPRNKWRVFATHPYPFFSFSSVSARGENPLGWPILGWATLLLGSTWCVSWPARDMILSPPRKIRQEVSYGNNPDDFPFSSHREMSHPKILHYILRIQKSLCGVDTIQWGCHNTLHCGVL